MLENEPCCQLSNVHEAHKAHAARWSPSEHLLSRHLPLVFKNAHSKCTPQYCDYQLPDHLYIYPRITSIKAYHASVKHLCLSVVLTHYDGGVWGHVGVPPTHTHACLEIANGLQHGHYD